MVKDLDKTLAFILDLSSTIGAPPCSMYLTKWREGQGL